MTRGMDEGQIIKRLSQGARCAEQILEARNVLAQIVVLPHAGVSCQVRRGNLTQSKIVTWLEIDQCNFNPLCEALERMSHELQEPAA